jgi:alkylation response protein AidB-like acyl-CoA dehydrogenase
MLYRAARLVEADGDHSAESAEAKVFISEASVRTHLDALQIHGGYGYMTEFEVERALRDALGGTIYSGTSEIQRKLIARRLGL